MPHLIVRRKHKLSTVQNDIERTKIKFEDLPKNLTIVDWLFLCASCSSMSFKVILWQNGKKGKRMLARFDGFDLIVHSMFPRLEYTGYVLLSPQQFVRCALSGLLNKGTIIATKRPPYLLKQSISL